MLLQKYIKNKINFSKGFTLIELLVVISIIGLLSSVVLTSLETARAKARDTLRVSTIREIQKALELYYHKYGYYPDEDIVANCNVGAFGSALDELVSEGFLASDPVDPVGDNINRPRNCFQYIGAGPNGYALQSAWFCDSVRRTDYQYALFFSTEETEYDFPGVSVLDFKYCVPGPLIE